MIFQLMNCFYNCKKKNQRKKYEERLKRFKATQNNNTTQDESSTTGAWFGGRHQNNWGVVKSRKLALPVISAVRKTNAPLGFPEAKPK